MDLLVSSRTNGVNPAYQDGDVVCTFTQEKCLWANAKNLCNEENAEPNIITGYYDNILLREFLEYTSIFKYVRLNSNEVERTRLADGEIDTVGGFSVNGGQSVTVEEFVKASLSTNDVRIFKVGGKEVWYSGFCGYMRIRSLWDKIHEHSNYRSNENTNWPLTDTEKKVFLSVSHCHMLSNGDGVTHIECNASTAAEKRKAIYENGVLKKRRRFFVPYWDYDYIDTDTVRDSGKESDFRDLLYNDHATANVDSDCKCKIQEGLHVVGAE